MQNQLTAIPATCARYRQKGVLALVNQGHQVSITQFYSAMFD